MPFTFAHPALVLPLLRYRPRWPWLSATGLVAGWTWVTHPGHASFSIAAVAAGLLGVLVASLAFGRLARLLPAGLSR